MRNSPRYRRALAGLVGTTLALTVPVWAASTASAAVGTTCTGTADASLDLYTATGTVALNAAGTVTAPVWGYATAGGATLTAPGGPLLEVTKGQSVQVTLHNGLGVPSSLSVPQMDGFVDDPTGVAGGSAKSYCFTPGRAGTYLYQAGATPTGGRQVAMGMAGVLVVRPAAGDAAQTSIDGTAGTAFDDQAPLLLQEIDPALNANPAGFDMRLYSPKFRLINGKTYPRTAAADHVKANAGKKLALRIVNAGLVEHSLGALGLRQNVVALGSHPLGHPYDVVAETLQPGQTLDAVVDVPAATPSSPSSYLLYETAAGNGTSSLQSFSGMATTIDVAGVTAPAGAPVVSGLSVSPTSVAAGTDVTVTGTATATDPATLASVQWQLDGAGAWTTVPTTASPFSVTVPTTGLAAGTHVVYVRAVDSANVTGEAATVSFTVQSTTTPADSTGPLVTGTTATPAKVKGSQSVTVTATADDRTTGGSNIASATISVDGGTPTAMTPNRTDNPVAALTATVATTSTTGHHTVSVLATDAAGNSTATAGTTAFDVDATVPTVAGITANPTYNNGQQESRVGSAAFAVSAVVSDATVASVGGSIGYGEGFIDTLGAQGTGFAMVPGTGVDVNSATAAANGVTVVAEIPLSQLTGLAAGWHSLIVRGRDGVGNWSAPVTNAQAFFVDRTAPTVSMSVSPNRGAPQVTVSGALTDAAPSSGFGAPAFVEAWVGTTDPGVGNGTRLTITGTAYSGSLTVPVPASGTSSVRVNVRARDAAGNVSAVSSTIVTVTANAIFSNGFEQNTNNLGWSSRTGAGVFTRITSASRITGTASGSVTLTGTAAGYVTDTTPGAETGYHATFDVRPLATGSSTTVFPVFRGTSTDAVTGTEVFRVEFQRTATANQMRIVAGGQTSAWATLPTTANAISAVRVDWTQGGASLTVGATTVSVAYTSALTLQAVHLGRTTAAGTGLGGSLVFDTFVSARDHLPLP